MQRKNVYTRVISAISYYNQQLILNVNITFENVLLTSKIRYPLEQVNNCFHIIEEISSTRIIGTVFYILLGIKIKGDVTEVAKTTLGHLLILVYSSV